MLKQWKAKLKEAWKDVKSKKKSAKGSATGSAVSSGPAEQQQPAGDKQQHSTDALSRPHGLTGRRSLDVSMTQQQQHQQDAGAAGPPAPTGRTSLEFAMPPASASAAGAAASSANPQQQQQPGDPQQLQQQQQQQQQAGALRPLDCPDRSAQGVDALMQSCPASPTAAHASTAGLQDAASSAQHASTHSSSAINGAAGTWQPESAATSGRTSPAAAAAAAAGTGTADGATDHGGSTLGGTAAGHHRLDVSRTPRDEDLGTCPPYAAKAVWGLRYAMEDKWAAVPNLIQLPLVLTCPPKKSKGTKSSAGCGCMPPAASKVLAKVSPSSRLSSSSSAGKDPSAGGAAATGTKPLGTQSPNPGLEKPSPDRQRLIGQHGLSSDAGDAQQQQHPDAAAAGGAISQQGSVTAGTEQGSAGGAAAAAGGGLGPQPGMDALHYFGVFDGHGGVDAARHCAHRMHQVVCSTILSMMQPDVAAAAVVSSLAKSSRHPALEHAGQQQQQPQDEQSPAAATASASAAPATPANNNDASSAPSTSSSNAAAGAAAATAAAAQPMPAIDIAASNGSWLLPALSRSFVSLDHEFGAISEGSYVGSTAVVVLVGSVRMWVAHAGDSRAILGRSGTVQVLTSDHKASRDDEVARVQAAGGHVWWDRVMGELAVSRAIGDHCLRPYVIPEPELLMVERSPEDEVLVMASDGLWDVMNNQEAVDMAVHSLQAAHASGHTGVSAVKRSANALTKAALERGTRDNVTVLVIDLRPRKPGTYEAAVSSTATTSSSHHSSSRHSSSRGHSSSSKGGSRTTSSSSKKAAAAAAAAAVSSSGTSGATSPAGVSAEANTVAMPPGTTTAAAAAVQAVPSAAAPATAAPAAPATAAAGTAPTAAAAAAAGGAGGVDLLTRTESDSETRALMAQHQHHPSASGGGI